MNAQPSTFTRKTWGLPHTLVTLATLLAAALRAWRVESLPPQAWYDEIWFALRARELLGGAPIVAHYGIADTAGNAGLVWLTALVRLFGIDSMVGARAVSALAGAITVPLAYACFREIFRTEFASKRRILAALAALIPAWLAVMVILGRVGIEPALAPPAALFCVWQVMLGLRRGRISHWVMAGLAAGLAQYNGPHARFILPLMAYVVIDWLWTHRLPSRTLGTWNLELGTVFRGAAALAVIGTLVCIPLIITFIAHPDWFYGRAEAVSAGVSLPENLLRVIGAFDIAGDLNARQNIPGLPMLDGVIGIGFVVGIIRAFWRIRRSAAARLLLVWLVLMAIPAALTAEAPNFGRMIGVVPPAAALAAIGWDAIAGWVGARRWTILTPQVRADLRIVAAGLVALSLGWNVELVFWRWAETPALADAFTTGSVKTADGLVQRAKNEAVYVDRLGEVLDEPAFAYLFAGTDIRRVDLRECVPMRAEPSAQAAYVILPEDDGLAASMLNVYKKVGWKKVDLNWDRQARLGLASGGLDLSGPHAYSAPGINLLGAKIGPAGALRTGDVLRVRLFWAVETTVEAKLAAFVQLYRADSAMLPPAAGIIRPPCGDSYPSTAWRPGEVIAFATSITLPDDLPPGEYMVTTGWVEPSTGLREILVSADEMLPENRAVIGRVTVSPR